MPALSEYPHKGERVVAGQHLMQASSDIFLGWARAKPTTGKAEDYYLRQLRDWKSSPVIEDWSTSNGAPTALRSVVDRVGASVAVVPPFRRQRGCPGP